MTAVMLKTLSSDGTEIAYWQTGTGGPALLLVHGTTADHTAFDAVLTGLEPHFTVFTMDRRGRGGSGDSARFSIEREFEDVAAVVGSIGAPVNVLGHSYGALCALEAAQLTSKITRLVLYDAPVINMGLDELPVGFVEELDELLDQGRRDQVLERVYQILGMSAAEIEQRRTHPSWPGRVAAAHTVPRELRAGALQYRFNWAALAEINQPTLLLCGEHSGPRLRASTAALHSVLPTSQVVVLRGQGHVGLRTSPELIASEVIAFLRGGA